MFAVEILKQSEDIINFVLREFGLQELAGLVQLPSHFLVELDSLGLVVELVEVLGVVFVGEFALP